MSQRRSLPLVQRINSAGGLQSSKSYKSGMVSVVSVVTHVVLSYFNEKMVGGIPPAHIFLVVTEIFIEN